jgi:hypothetical protein
LGYHWFPIIHFVAYYAGSDCHGSTQCPHCYFGTGRFGSKFNIGQLGIDVSLIVFFIWGPGLKLTRPP